MALADRIDELETMLWIMRETCQKCRNPEGNTILCDKCENGWHTTCLNPPLKNIPEGKYYFKSSSKQNSMIRNPNPKRRCPKISHFSSFIQSPVKPGKLKDEKMLGCHFAASYDFSTHLFVSN